MTALMYIGGLGSGMDYDRGRLAQFFGVRARELLIPGEEVLPLRGYLQAFGRQMSLRGTALLFLFICYLLHTPMLRARKSMQDSDGFFDIRF